MYALAARDKLHKRENDQYKERHSPRFGGKSNGKRQKGKEERPTSVQKEARVSHCEKGEVAMEL